MIRADTGCIQPFRCDQALPLARTMPESRYLVEIKGDSGWCFEVHTYPISTLSAPSGVTNIGGANV